MLLNIKNAPIEYVESGMSLEDALNYIGNFVVADGGEAGTYIGELEDLYKENNRCWGRVRILGTYRYPTQNPNYFEPNWMGNLPLEMRANFALKGIAPIEVPDKSKLYGFHSTETKEKAFNKAYSILNKYANGRKLDGEEFGFLRINYFNLIDGFDKNKANQCLNILRLHAKLLDINIIKRKIKVDRTPWTEWTITINEPSNSSYYEAFYRTTFREGRECELFTLLPMHSDNVLLQIYIFPNEVRHVTWVPASIRTNHEEKTIFIDLLVHIETKDSSIQSITLNELNTIDNRILG